MSESSSEPRTEAQKAARRGYSRVLRARLKERGLPPDDPRHGKYTTYDNWICRCDKCTKAKAAQNKANATRRNQQRRERERMAKETEK
jgi:hypothetical protein